MKSVIDDDEFRFKPTTRTLCTTTHQVALEGSFICLVAHTRLDIARPLITQSWTTGSLNGLIEKSQGGERYGKSLGIRLGAYFLKP